MVFGKFFTYMLYDEYWLDDDTYLLVFKDEVDGVGDTFHMEVEYHVDEKRFTYEHVWEYDHQECVVPFGVKKEIEEYVLRKVGVINGTINTPTINIKLNVDCDLDATIGELHEWVKNASIKVEMPKSNKFNLLSVDIVS